MKAQTQSWGGGWGVTKDEPGSKLFFIKEVFYLSLLSVLSQNDKRSKFSVLQETVRGGVSPEQ